MLVGDFDASAGEQRVGRAEDDGIGAGDTGKNFDGAAVIAADLDGNEFYFTVADDADLEAFFAEEQCV